MLKALLSLGGSSLNIFFGKRQIASETLASSGLVFFFKCKDILLD